MWIRAKKIKIYLRMSTVAACCVFLSLSARHLSETKHHKKESSLSAKQVIPYLASHNSDEMSFMYAVESLIDTQRSDVESRKFYLVDEIINLIHNYYVDKNLVSNRLLLKGIIEYLDFYGDEISVTNDKLRYYIRIGKNIGDIMIAKDVSTYHLSRFVLMLAKFLDYYEEVRQENKHSAFTSEPSLIQIINAMMDGLDVHSLLMSRESYRELEEGTKGEFGGLGILVGVRDYLLTIIKPLPGSPALASGIREKCLLTLPPDPKVLLD